MPESRHPRNFHHYESHNFSFDRCFNQIDLRSILAEFLQFSIWNRFDQGFDPRCWVLIPTIRSSISQPFQFVDIPHWFLLSNSRHACNLPKTIRALSTAFPILPSFFLPVNWFWYEPFSSSKIFLNLLEKLLVFGPKVLSPNVLPLILLPMTKSFKVPFKWLNWLFWLHSFFLWEPFCVNT